MSSETSRDGNAQCQETGGFLRLAPQALLASMALFAAAWAIARACVQAVTGDEAETYEIYVLWRNGSEWSAAASNHVLNSLLMRCSTGVFGLSPLSVRIPALTGAALYIATAYWLCRMLSRDWKIQAPIFACLVYNPFIFDFFVAARGYGMANAFLLCAIAVPAWCYLELANGRRRPLEAAYALSSVCLGLSFAANFSFGLVDASALAALLFWAFRKSAEARASRARLLTAAIAPGLCVTVLIPLWTILHWPRGQLFEGAESLAETARTVVEASLFRVNPHMANPYVYSFLTAIADYLIPITCLLAALLTLVLFLDRSKPRDPRARWLGALAGAASGVTFLSILAHWFAFRFFHLLLPRHRTAIFFVPLVTLAIGALASIPPASRAGRWSRNALMACLFLTATYFAFCLRLTYFKEWQYQEDLKRVYDVVACYNHSRNIRDVEVSWWYHAGSDFYRLLSGRETFAPFTSSRPHPTDRQLYILNGAFEQDFIAAQQLKIVYRGESTDVVVAVRPELGDFPILP